GGQGRSSAAGNRRRLRQRDAARPARRRHGDRERPLGLRAGRAGIRRVRREAQASRPDAGTVSRGDPPRGRLLERRAGRTGAAFLRWTDGRTRLPSVRRWLEPGGAWYVVV